MKVRRMGGRLVTGVGLLALLAACGEREVILQGERFPVRADLAASVPVEGQPAPTAPAAPENRSVAISLGPQTGGDWTHRAGNARHLMPHAALSATPQRVWSASIGSGSTRRNRIAAAPVVADGRVFTIDSGTTVTATSTGGATLWTADLTAPFDRGGGQSAGGLAIAGGRVFATTGYGELVALDAGSGAVL
ncbi:MAG: PQQ-binding-like beta-propeller repeat protein, partial [Tabrizicola sp.]